MVAKGHLELRENSVRARGRGPFRIDIIHTIYNLVRIATILLDDDDYHKPTTLPLTTAQPTTRTNASLSMQPHPPTH